MPLFSLNYIKSGCEYKIPALETEKKMILTKNNLFLDSPCQIVQYTAKFLYFTYFLQKTATQSKREKAKFLFSTKYVI